MSLNLVSPGVKVREVDLTIGNITGANDQVGAIAGPFEKGPIDVPILIENEQDLLATYGKPLSQDAQFEYWMTASSYLSYGGTLRVLRSDGGNLNNAKLTKIIDDLGINSAKLNIDMTKKEVTDIVNLSSFLANGSGARGTPTFFINEEFVVGYISIERIKALLN